MGPPWRLIVPGIGVGPAIVGRSSAEEVLDSFGTDCKVSRYESGEIFEISYDYENEDDYEADRPAQAARPSDFAFEFGLLKAIGVGVYQVELATREGVRIGMPGTELVRLLGPPSYVLAGSTVDTLRYVVLGIELDVDHDDHDVNNLTVFRARW
jgi:hypothetical protein